MSKGNQETLYDDVKLYFETALKAPQSYHLMNINTLIKGHGRIEKRKYYLTTDVTWLEERKKWSGLNAIGMVQSNRIVDGVESMENRYFISSVTEIKHFCEAVRGHWEIENNLHWCLDEIFNEDKCRMRMDNSGENFAVVRHIVMNLYKPHFKPKLSLKSKRFRCSFDDEFLSSVVLNKFS